MGTKESIISGPYDLGAGGGSGGGVTKISIKPVNWPSTVVVGSKAVFSVTWSSTVGDAQEPTGDGTFYVSVNDKQVLVLPNKSQGIVELDLSNYLIAGANNIQIKILDVDPLVADNLHTGEELVGCPEAEGCQSKENDRLSTFTGTHKRRD